MTSFNELVIGSSQGFAFLLKIITEVFQDYVHLQGHGLAMISHKCEPSVSKEFNLFSVVDFYCLCVCHSNSPTVCSALKNGHLLCRIEHFHFLDGILTSLCIFYSILYTVLSLSWTVCAVSGFFSAEQHSMTVYWKLHCFLFLPRIFLLHNLASLSCCLLLFLLLCSVTIWLSRTTILWLAGWQLDLPLSCSAGSHFIPTLFQNWYWQQPNSQP